MDTNDYCTCKHCSSVSSEFDDWYEWDVCCDCGKVIEDSCRSLDHYEGEDHVYYEDC